MDSSSHSVWADLERSASAAIGEVYHLRLYISGITPRSTTAIANIKQVCEERLPDRYELEVVDIYQQPELARQYQIVAVPTLLKLSPKPAARLIGDMSDLDRVLRGLNLHP